jgi:hypothetical protein
VASLAQLPAPQTKDVRDMKYLSQIMTSASGSMNGVTASHNKGGQYFRRRAIPVNPNTAAQAAARAALSTLTTEWGTVLTEAQRQAWNEYAQVVPVTNKLGESIKLSGQQMFIRGNQVRVNNPDADIAYDGPTVMNRGSFTPVTNFSMSNEGVFSGDVNTEDEWYNDPQSFMIVQVSRPISPGVQYFKGPYQISSPYLVGDTWGRFTQGYPFSNVPVGQNVFARIRVSFSDGRLSDVQYAGPIVIEEV